ncbi:unnamed protein product [Paramecium octaurelia]|uniref:Uncharacterized protein n=1 Tax=Paramecium octaurelia TaxID=43137 RepID=A0A8S1UM74_PAROT|nr:unnamed protein product [Paramecium octaurelia]
MKHTYNEFKINAITLKKFLLNFNQVPNQLLEQAILFKFVVPIHRILKVLYLFRIQSHHNSSFKLDNLGIRILLDRNSYIQNKITNQQRSYPFIKENDYFMLLRQFENHQCILVLTQSCKTLRMNLRNPCYQNLKLQNEYKSQFD